MTEHRQGIPHICLAAVLAAVMTWTMTPAWSQDQGVPEDRDVPEKWRIAWLQLIPDVEGGAVRVRAALESQSGGPAMVSLLIEDRQGRRRAEPRKRWVGTAKGRTVVDLGVVVIDDPQLWSPSTPYLYIARCTLTDPQGQLLHVHNDRFGLRSFERRGNRFFLNGKPFRLFGADLFGEAHFKEGYQATLDPAFVHRYLIEYPKRMNVNAFRTHADSMDERWLSVCDKGGMLLVLELPAFGWGDDADPRSFEQAEYEALLPKLWNHPSIVIWSISPDRREDQPGTLDNEAIVGWLKEQDPSRSVLRAGQVSSDIADIHTHEGLGHGSMADFLQLNEDLTRRFSDRPIANTGYLESGTGPDGWWHNRNRARRFFDDAATPGKLTRLHAEFAMEQTELLRRLGFQMILACRYPDWVDLETWARHDGEDGYPKVKPTAWALRQAFSPCGVSLEVENRHVWPGKPLRITTWIMNDTDEPRELAAVPAILPSDQSYRLGELGLPPVTVDHVTVAAHASESFDSLLPVPDVLGGRETDGTICLAAVLYGQGQPIAFSRRTLHVHQRRREALHGIKVLLMEPDEEIETFLREQEAQIHLDPAEAPDDAVILFPETSQGPTAPAWQKALDRVRSGARAVVLRMGGGGPGPSLPELPEVYEPDHSTDYLFPAEGVRLSAVRDPNGPAPALSNTLRVNRILDRVLLYGYPDSSGKPTAAILARTVGRGTLICCQVRLADRLAETARHADPVCRRLLIQLLSQQTP